MNIISPNWPAPENIVAFSTTREGGHSDGVYRGLNMAQHVGDACEKVGLNRAELTLELPAVTAIAWLTQTHGREVVEAGNSSGTPLADASWASAPGVACAVMTADCLPVLLCSKNGNKIAAAHAGWRGLAQGVLEACVVAMAIEPSDIMAWLGPAIGPDAFEVGGDVREQFLANCPAGQHTAVLQCFRGRENKSGFFLADLYALARIRLNSAGVSEVFGGGLCTYTDASRFYSYRRDGQTGRMATIIAKIPDLNR
ncbi:MAG: peptidoglycan editing factor PgeF [Proteobacteria bacterium]|nr:peptidoglycan editing factor PgeF [Pseudomonadota bacterium]